MRRIAASARLKSPAIFHNEALTGVVAPHFTAFPTAIALMRATGMLHALAPVMGVALDARWGRVTETYGEDLYLVRATSVPSRARLQGPDRLNPYGA